MPHCSITGEEFYVSDLERSLRAQFEMPGDPRLCPAMRLRHLGAFWHHWGIHKRRCDATGRDIVSVFPSDCPYPVWEHSHWIEHADPPSAELKADESLFAQMWHLFSQCPIPHNTGAGNENCDYTDDWWYSRNCYLCHSGVSCEDLKYCYRTYKVRDSQFCVFTFDSELAVDLVNCKNCYRVIHSINSYNCRDSAFLYDCRNCNNCLFCTNLRNKEYFIDNVFVGRERFEQALGELHLTSRKKYEEATARFRKLVASSALHRAVHVDLCESSTGDYLTNCKNSIDCFFAHDCEDAVNCIRGGLGLKTALDCIAFDSRIEKVSTTAFVTRDCYDIRCCYNVAESQFLEYCAFCLKCKNCFGCAGLVGKEFHILNSPVPPAEYPRMKEQAIAQMKRSSEYGAFFPGYFAATPYDESWSGFHHPLSATEQVKKGFRPRSGKAIGKPSKAPAAIPDDSTAADTSTAGQLFWDSVESRPINIQSDDIEFARRLGVPLTDRFYIRRLQDNFRLLPFSGTLRNTVCAGCEKGTGTSMPVEFDGRILCENCYLDRVV